MAELKRMGSQNLANLIQTLSSEGLPVTFQSTLSCNHGLHWCHVTCTCLLLFLLFSALLLLLSITDSSIAKMVSMMWLDTKQEGSVIYVSFGSLVGLHERQKEETLQGLGESGRPFLLAIRSLGGEEMKAVKEEWSEDGLVTRQQLQSWWRGFGPGVRAMINEERVEGKDEIKKLTKGDNSNAKESCLIERSASGVVAVFGDRERGVPEE
ncbi:hypothetical protein RJ639_013583 [Escallonia herrerae]|uniref:Uncharacterized protein n=1 Tax=Escallonia herrerae TaxID=1293975 RepID=A0AA89AKP4_9ASTE|nr:hypothetical protein RJ639_013583 [Escallonia herrerae]